MVWGDGSAVRDFLYSHDAAEGIIRTMHFNTYKDFINLGSGIECSIKELVETLSEIIGFDYVFDASKNGGFKKRVMDISLAKELLEFQPETTLKEGLKRTWKWFVNNKDEYLKRKNYFNDRG